MVKRIKKYLNTLYSFERSGMKYNLKNISKILKLLGDPHNNFDSIHIAGTNGKGATASMTAAMLSAHGYKTGLFTSPHILKFNERIRINGECISDADVIRFIEDNLSIFRKIKPSFFEVCTALAFYYFSLNKVEIAVIETGLGGRLDATNILKPKVIAITQISLDHQNYLGSTIKKIAEEKLGIVKNDTPVILNNTTIGLNKIFYKFINMRFLFDVNKYFQIVHIEQIKKSNQIFYFISKELGISKKTKLVLPVIGEYQIRNALTSLFISHKYITSTHNSLNLSLAVKSLNDFNLRTGYRCRFEKMIVGSNTFIFDVSHNPEGIQLAMGNCKGDNPIIIFGMMSDKDYKTCIKILLTFSYDIIFTQAKYKRALQSKTLYNFAESEIKRKRKERCSNIYKNLSVKSAIKLATKLAYKQKPILVLGSFFLVSEVIKILKLEKKFT